MSVPVQWSFRQAIQRFAEEQATREATLLVPLSEGGPDTSEWQKAYSEAYESWMDGLPKLLGVLSVPQVIGWARHQGAFLTVEMDLGEFEMTPDEAEAEFEALAPGEAFRVVI